MVNVSQVNSVMDSLSSNFNSYNSLINELSGSWEGTSYDNLVSKANEFSSEYFSTIQSQLNSFAEACSLYSQYTEYKEKKAIYQNKYNIAISNDDDTNISFYINQMNMYQNKLLELKNHINSCLESASSVVLENNSVNKYIQSAIDWIVATANDDTHGYSQVTRYGNPNYDCSSLVISAYEAAGVPVKEAGAGYTGNMRSAFTKVGFEWIPGNPSMEDLQPGDVLLNEATHTEMYIGNGQNVGAHGNLDGKDGDSSGYEISITDYYGTWEGVLRYVGNPEDGNLTINN